MFRKWSVVGSQFAGYTWWFKTIFIFVSTANYANTGTCLAFLKHDHICTIVRGEEFLKYR
jgi:hypothetical protein